MSTVRIALLVVASALWLSVAEAPAQQTTISSPFHTIGDSFYEQIGMSWGFNAPGFFFRFGPGNMPNPPFGGFVPGSGATMGFAFGNPGGTNAFFNIVAAQGSRQSMVSQTPSMTLMNGQGGYMADTSVTPFVISQIPVVGGFPVLGAVGQTIPPAYRVPSYSPPPALQPERIEAARKAFVERKQGQEQKPEPPARPPAPTDPAAAKVAEAQASSAGRPVPGVAEAKRMHELEQAAQNREVEALFEKGRAAEEDGKLQTAKMYYQMVARRASGELKEQAQARLAALRSAAEH